MPHPYIGTAYGVTSLDLAQAHVERLLTEAERSRATRETQRREPPVVESRPHRRGHRLPALHHA